MRTAFEHAAGLGDAARRAGELSARTVIFDVEPLVAYWNGTQETLDEGIARVLSEIAKLPMVEVVCFSTNSVRRPSVVPSPAGVRVVYLASAAKPLRTTAYHGFPRPGVVIGDQVATDGILARRLGYAFIQLDPPGRQSRRPAADGGRGAAGAAAVVHRGRLNQPSRVRGLLTAIRFVIISRRSIVRGDAVASRELAKARPDALGGSGRGRRDQPGGGPSLAGSRPAAASPGRTPRWRCRAVRGRRDQRPPGRARRLPPRARPGRCPEPDLGHGGPVLADRKAARGRHVRCPRRPAGAVARSPGPPARDRRRRYRGDDHLAGPRRQRGEHAAPARDAAAHRDRGAARRARIRWVRARDHRGREPGHPRGRACGPRRRDRVRDGRDPL